MTLLQSIQTLRDTAAHSAVDEAIERIKDDLDRYLPAMEPEELDHTRLILERLLDLQAAAVRSATARGATMSERLASSLALGEGREAA